MRSRYITGSRNGMQCRASHPTDLLQAFRPLPLLTNPHAQTIVAAKLTFAYEPPVNVQVICTRHGGHLGFLGLPGRAGGYRAMDAQLLAWISAQ